MKKIILYLISALALYACSESDGPEVLPAPEDLSASDDLALTIELSWNAVPGADSYKIFRRDYYSSEDSLEEISEVEAVFFTDLSVESNSSYEYYVAAYNGVLGVPSDTVLGSTRPITTEEAFDVLAEFTDGEAYESSGAWQVSEVIQTVIGDHAQATGDIVFLIDNTGSMSDDIYYVKSNLSEIIASLPQGVQVGVGQYGDINVDPDNWYQYAPLSTDLEAVTDYINSIRTSSGGDYPESVYDALYVTMEEMNWSSSVQKMIIVIGDAPPLEGSYSYYTLKNVIDKANEEGIITNLYPILVH